MFQMENTEANAIATLANPALELNRGDLAAIHQDYKIADLEQFQEGRNRARGLLKTPSFEDFKSFVLDSNPHKNEDELVVPTPAPVFVDHKNVSATAILTFL